MEAYTSFAQVYDLFQDKLPPGWELFWKCWEVLRMNKTYYVCKYTPIELLEQDAPVTETVMSEDEALRHTGYKGSQKIFTSLQVELIFRYLGKP